MWLTSYRRVLAAPGVRLALLLGMLIRVPVFAGSVVLALHVVSGLGLGYSSAGVVVFLYTAMVAVSAPWRGRLLDRLGLRRVVLPSLVVLTVCWSTGPFLGFVPLLVTATLAGLFNIPVFSIIRQTIMASVADGDRRTALSAESVAVELAYMIGPLVGVFLATTVPTSWRSLRAS